MVYWISFGSSGPLTPKSWKITAIAETKCFCICCTTVMYNYDTVNHRGFFGKKNILSSFVSCNFVK